MNVCQELCYQLGVKGDFEEVIRIGRNTSRARPRLICVKCRSLDTKTNILRNAKKLHEQPTFRGVFVNPDRTKLQQRNDKLLRDELKRRKDLGEDVMILRNKIVNRHDNTNFRIV